MTLLLAEGLECNILTKEYCTICHSRQWVNLKSKTCKKCGSVLVYPPAQDRGWLCERGIKISL